MTKRRAFMPPATCSKCGQRPFIGETLFHTGSAWLCAACLTDESTGLDVITKVASRELQSSLAESLAVRAKCDGDLVAAQSRTTRAQWHHQAASAIYAHGTRLAKQAPVVHGEAATKASGYMKDTLADPDLVAIESSETRGRLLQQNDVIALGVDIAKTVCAANTAEKLIAHEIAVAHKAAMNQASMANWEPDPKLQLQRLHASAKMMAMAQAGLLALQKLKAAGPQSVTVQHVHVNAGGQAVVGSVQTQPSRPPH